MLVRVFSDFLSRLCGGECFLLKNEPIAIFLSRLCGGECAEMLVRVFSDFLSRLCGGE